ncbi:hypothetical protein LHYA1_G008954 [Lachnellula hyalina]|uniref:Uncharacterized protein n=1 Tax=Lachnellula hyalina TaxID=1316788 RepID=A0A8H8QU43_9HELO|nr:uncharacterized protein LHYA1_G008954 [Lachnellula hyalina]TVY22784.1 hypothetical protein LHYA1_G008954 [Lachnellula hyalina]
MAPIPLSNLEAASSAISNIAKRLPIDLTNSVLGRDPTALPTPTTTTSTARSLFSRILSSKRSTTSIIPTGYGAIDSGPAPGTIVGIVLGSVGGFLLILWLIYTCLNFGAPVGFGGGESAYTESVVRERRKSHHSGSRRSRRPSETIEIRSHSQVRAPSPIRIVREPSPPRAERIIVEEHREERRRGGDDEVVVIEEHSPPRRKKSHRDREREISRERDVDSGFRTVDPLAYGGVVGGNPRRGSRRGRD